MLPLPIISASQNCSSIGNFSWAHCPQPLDLEAQIMLPLNLLALLLNSWALVIFRRHVTGNGILLLWISSLCICEISLNACLLSHFIFYLAMRPCDTFPNFHAGPASAAIFHLGGLVQTLALAALLFRNWTFAALALVRFEAVLRVTSRRWLNRRRSLILMVAMATVGLGVSAVRGLRTKAVYCDPADNGDGHSWRRALVLPHLYSSRWFFYFEAHFCGLLQTLAPLLCVVGLSGAAALRLLAGRRANKRAGLRRHLRQQQQQQQQPQHEAATLDAEEPTQPEVRPSSDRVHLMVAYLCAVFLICESPVLVLYNLEHFTRIGQELFWVSNVCIATDSVLNFVGYAVTNSQFRARLLCRDANRQRLPATALLAAEQLSLSGLGNGAAFSSRGRRRPAGAPIGNNEI